MASVSITNLGSASYDTRRVRRDSLSGLAALDDHVVDLFVSTFAADPFPPQLHFTGWDDLSIIFWILRVSP